MAHVSLKNVSIDYPVYGSKSGHLRFKIFNTMVGGKFDTDSSIIYVKALKNIDLELQDGDRVGLTGHNGSGKTTLLRTLARVYAPSTGSIAVSGKSLQLFDISHTVNGDATGFENIFLKAYSMGFSQKEIEQHLDDIIGFSELGDYIELPMHTYSQGMMLRLFFSIVTSFRPDILLIDEVIGVGDKEFREKAQARMRDLIEKTEIVVIASHDDALLDTLCNRRLTLRSGEIIESKMIPGN